VQFQGFTQQTLDILKQIHGHNSRNWFEEHRSEYERFLLQPMRILAADLSEVISQIDPEIETRPTQVVSRIRRDTRFSNDKTLYKKSMWLTFKRPIDNWQDSPAFYFELFPDWYRYGMGFYTISRETLGNIRRAIEAKPEDVRGLLRSVKRINGMELAGEEYKRLPAEEVPADLKPLYIKRNLFFVLNRPQMGEAIFSSRIMNELSACFVRLGSMYHFLHDIRYRGEPEKSF